MPSVSGTEDGTPAVRWNVCGDRGIVVWCEDADLAIVQLSQSAGYGWLL